MLYIDNFRGRQIDARADGLRVRAALIAAGLADGAEDTAAAVESYGHVARGRVLLFSPKGPLIADSWRATGPTFQLVDPQSSSVRLRIALGIDRTINAIAGVRPLPTLSSTAPGNLSRWTEAVRAARTGRLVSTIRLTPDGAPIVSAAAVAPKVGIVLLQADARDITDAVRRERLIAFIVFLSVLGFSVLLSTFLARTIVDPVRLLADATARVRLGRERNVIVPRLPGRRDEIGRLARSVSDMALALRSRIDKTEAFAADVAHELKNPLASLRSALETLARVEDPHLRARLVGVMQDDVARLDRLITDIALASRLEAEISRARFGRVELGALARDLAGRRGTAEIIAQGDAVTLGDAARLRQVADNLVDNAVSFSPPGGTVLIRVEQIGQTAALYVEDEGPGVAPELREAIFQRFYSHRPDESAFGRHSGLGLAIVRAIVEAHGGTIEVGEREGGGARFCVRLRAA